MYSRSSCPPCDLAALRTRCHFHFDMYRPIGDGYRGTRGRRHQTGRRCRSVVIPATVPLDRLGWSKCNPCNSTQLLEGLGECKHSRIQRHRNQSRFSKPLVDVFWIHEGGGRNGYTIILGEFRENFGITPGSFISDTFTTPFWWRPRKV